ncbi:hypothetical protein PVA44_06945 (plasmid) [Entomospira nematocerorum]|uniref:Uncharacterized protein n=1 Tax=Entomospira nematocerorum TaxID=2719987 RepID=A0A968KVS8_9SPIO|nr:hypothetical protein [Entomospira nematocera]NIZ47643.1 hypothetical protein [Entomospira nematocera]WDI34536.1 hypothetical protein PVA44_06945 [Entomospira nematocera]
MKVRHVTWIVLVLFLLSPFALASEVVQLHSNKYVFSFSLESFHRAWKAINQTLSAPFEHLSFSDPVTVPSRGRYIYASLTQSMRLTFQLDPHVDHITAIYLTASQPSSPFEVMVLHNSVAMLVSLLDHEISEHAFDQILVPLQDEMIRTHVKHNRIIYISFINNIHEFILVMVPSQRNQPQDYIRQRIRTELTQ